MRVPVIDEAANREKMITHAVKIIGRSQDRLKVFEAIYFHKSPTKTQEFIKNRSGSKSLKRVLEVGNALVAEGIIEQTDVKKRVAYKKIPFYKKNKSVIINRVRKKQFDDITKLMPINSGQINIKVNLKNKSYATQELTIDDIDSFSKVRRIAKSRKRRIPEERIKELLKFIVGEDGKFTDWGGEINDINTTRLIIKGKRINSSFALKGKGTPPPLTQKKMGKNGDQISRLFKSPSQAFFVMYDDQITQSVLDLMKELAEAKARRERKKIYYGIIDGQDTAKLFSAYKK